MRRQKCSLELAQRACQSLVLCVNVCVRASMSASVKVSSWARVRWRTRARACVCVCWRLCARECAPACVSLCVGVCEWAFMRVCLFAQVYRCACMLVRVEKRTRLFACVCARPRLGVAGCAGVGPMIISILDDGAHAAQPNSSCAARFGRHWHAKRASAPGLASALPGRGKRQHRRTGVPDRWTPLRRKWRALPAFE